MVWNGNKINDYFVKLSEMRNPERHLVKGESFYNLYDIELAEKKIYESCAFNAWTKERLLNSLDNIIKSKNSNIKAKDPKKYVEIQINEAIKLRDSILDGSFRIE